LPAAEQVAAKGDRAGFVASPHLLVSEVAAPQESACAVCGALRVCCMCREGPEPAIAAAIAELQLGVLPESSSVQKEVWPQVAVLW